MEEWSQTKKSPKQFLPILHQKVHQILINTAYSFPPHLRLNTLTEVFAELCIPLSEYKTSSFEGPLWSPILPLPSENTQHSHLHLIKRPMKTGTLKSLTAKHSLYSSSHHHHNLISASSVPISSHVKSLYCYSSTYSIQLN